MAALSPVWLQFKSCLCQSQCAVQNWFLYICFGQVVWVCLIDMNRFGPMGISESIFC